MNSPPLFLLAFANDRDDRAHYLRNLPEELRRITDSLDQAKAQGLCEYVYLANATLKQILDTFQKAEYRNRIAVFHYGGHANSLQWLLETAAGKAAAIDVAGLAAFLGQQRGLELIFLNGCSTRKQVEAFEASVPMVIATSQAIDDQVAMEFASRFYRGLASGAHVQSAYKEAESAVQSAGNGNVRHLYHPGAQRAVAEIQEERWPWELYFKKGAESEGQWNLPETVGNPLFGVPPVPPGDLPYEPFRHLAWFAREHAEIFFGRNYQIRQLYDRLTEPNAAPIILLYGQAGVGKSSLLDAGLTPRLQASHKVIYLRRNQDLGLVQTATQGLTPTKQHDSLSSAWLEREKKDGRPLALILDQVEEVFTRPSGDPQLELQHFLEALEETFASQQSRPEGRLILGFRKEWESEIEQQLKEYKLPHAKVFLQPLDRPGVIQAVGGVTKSERLQRQYGLVIEAGLPELIADDLSSDPDSPLAPTLQILLTRMWAEAKRVNDSAPSFNLALYRRLKEEGILLGDFLDQQLSRLREKQSEVVVSGLALDVLANHTTPLGTAEQRTEAQIRQEYKHHLPVASLLLEELKELYLIADPPQDQKDEVSRKATRLAHDTLAPLVRARYDKSVLPGQRARRVLENRSPDWQGTNVGVALDARDLTTVELGANGMRDWTADEQRLITASRQLRDQRDRRNKILRVAGFAAVAAIVVIAGLAWWQRTKAREAEQRAIARQLAAQADTLETSQARLLMRRVLLAIEANRRSVSGESVNALHSSLRLLPLRRRRFKHDDAVLSAEFSQDGKLLGTGSKDKTARVWNLADGKEVIRVKHDHPVKSVVFSNDGRYFVSVSGEGGQDEPAYAQAKLWDFQKSAETEIMNEQGFPGERAKFIRDTHSLVIQARGLIRVVLLTDSQPQVTFEIQRFDRRMTLSPDGIILASQDNLRIYLDDLVKKVVSSFVISPNLGNRYSPNDVNAMSDERREAFEKGLRENQADGFAFSQDRQNLAIATFDGLIHIFDWEGVSEISPKPERSVTNRLGNFKPALAFSPEDNYLAFFGRTLNARVFEKTTGQELWSQTLETVNVSNDREPFVDLTFAGSTRLVVASGDSTVRLFDLPLSAGLNTRSKVNETLRITSEAYIDSMAVSPDATQIATGDETGWVDVWYLQSSLEREMKNGVLSLYYSPSGRHLVSYELTGTKIFEVANSRLVAQCNLERRQGVFALTNEYLAVSDSEGRVKVCELATGSVVREFALNSEARNLVFSPTKPVLLAITRDAEYARELDLKTGTVREIDNIELNREARFSGDGTYLVTVRPKNPGSGTNPSATGGVLEMYETNSREKKLSLSSDDKSYQAPTFSPDGRYLAVLTRGNGPADEIIIWESRTGEEVRRIPGEIYGYNFSDDSRYVVAPLGTQVRVLNLLTGEVIVIETLANIHRSILSPDSEHLLTQSDENLMQVWRVPDGTRELQVEVDMPVPNDLLFSPDQRYIIFTGHDRPADTDGQPSFDNPRAQFMLWRSQDLIEEGCSRVTRNLTRDEWTQYLGNEPYRKTCPDLP